MDVISLVGMTHRSTRGVDAGAPVGGAWLTVAAADACEEFLEYER
jgi:hypothetical protein